MSENRMTNSMYESEVEGKGLQADIARKIQFGELGTWRSFHILFVEIIILLEQNCSLARLTV